MVVVYHCNASTCTSASELSLHNVTQIYRLQVCSTKCNIPKKSQGNKKTHVKHSSDRSVIPSDLKVSICNKKNCNIGPNNRRRKKKSQENPSLEISDSFVKPSCGSCNTSHSNICDDCLRRYSRRSIKKFGKLQNQPVPGSRKTSNVGPKKKKEKSGDPVFDINLQKTNSDSFTVLHPGKVDKKVKKFGQIQENKECPCEVSKKTKKIKGGKLNKTSKPATDEVFDNKLKETATTVLHPSKIDKKVKKLGQIQENKECPCEGYKETEKIKEGKLKKTNKPATGEVFDNKLKETDTKTKKSQKAKHPNKIKHNNNVNQDKLCPSCHASRKFIGQYKSLDNSSLCKLDANEKPTSDNCEKTYRDACQYCAQCYGRRSIKDYLKRRQQATRKDPSLENEGHENIAVISTTTKKKRTRSSDNSKCKDDLSQSSEPFFDINLLNSNSMKMCLLNPNEIEAKVKKLGTLQENKKCPCEPLQILGDYYKKIELEGKHKTSDHKATDAYSYNTRQNKPLKTQHRIKGFIYPGDQYCPNLGKDRTKQESVTLCESEKHTKDTCEKAFSDVCEYCPRCYGTRSIRNYLRRQRKYSVPFTISSKKCNVCSNPCITGASHIDRYVQEGVDLDKKTKHLNKRKKFQKCSCVNSKYKDDISQAGEPYFDINLLNANSMQMCVLNPNELDQRIKTLGTLQENKKCPCESLKILNDYYRKLMSRSKSTNVLRCNCGQKSSDKIKAKSSKLFQENQILKEKVCYEDSLCPTVRRNTLPHDSKSPKRRNDCSCDSEQSLSKQYIKLSISGNNALNENNAFIKLSSSPPMERKLTNIENGKRRGKLRKQSRKLNLRPRQDLTPKIIKNVLKNPELPEDQIIATSQSDNLSTPKRKLNCKCIMSSYTFRRKRLRLPKDQNKKILYSDYHGQNVSPKTALHQKKTGKYSFRKQGNPFAKHIKKINNLPKDNNIVTLKSENTKLPKRKGKYTFIKSNKSKTNTDLLLKSKKDSIKSIISKIVPKCLLGKLKKKINSDNSGLSIAENKCSCSKDEINKKSLKNKPTECKCNSKSPVSCKCRLESSICECHKEISNRKNTKEKKRELEMRNKKKAKEMSNRKKNIEKKKELELRNNKKAKEISSRKKALEKKRMLEIRNKKNALLLKKKNELRKLLRKPIKSNIKAYKHNKKDRKVEKQKMKIAEKKRIKEKKLRKKQIKELMESKDTTTEETSVPVEVGKILMTYTSKTVWMVLKTSYNLIRKPKKSINYVLDRARDPNETFKKVRNTVQAELKFIKMRLDFAAAGSYKANVIIDAINDIKLIDSFKRGRTKKEQAQIESKRKARKLRIKQRDHDAKYCCQHGILLTLRKHPCMCCYHIWPSMYPQCLSFVIFFRNLWNICLFTFALCCWTPCIAAFEILRALCCCMLCTH